jgi:D-inositol-3-phosphate glycosyltransferase
VRTSLDDRAPILEDELSQNSIPHIAMLSVHTCPLATLGGKETGGMNVYVRELARELGNRGLPVDVFTRSQDPDIKRISYRLGNAVRVVHLPAGPERPYNKNETYNHLPEFVDGIRRFAASEGITYDVLHSHYWLSGLAAHDLRETPGPAAGAPIVHMFHTLAELKNRVATSALELEPVFRSNCEGEIIRFADVIVAATTLEREQMQTFYGADPAKVEIVPPGVDLDLFRPLPCDEARAAVGVPPDHHMILFVGRIQAIKGIDTLIRAMAVLVGKRPHLKGKLALTIIGGAGDPATDGELARLQALEQELGIDDVVTFTGSRDQDTLVNYYNAASMVVVPSHYESFGMVALEAMACGTPVIASDVGGLSLNVADGFNGYLIPQGDVDELAYKMELLLEHDQLRAQLGTQACQWAQRFSWQTIADETLAVYAHALRRPESDLAPYMYVTHGGLMQLPQVERECP